MTQGLVGEQRQEARFAILRRAAVWAVFAGLLYLLRDFLLLIFLTFVFSYSAGLAVRALEPRLPRAPRGLLAVSIFVGSLLALVGLGVVLVPRVEDEVENVRRSFPAYRDKMVNVFQGLSRDYPRFAQTVDPVAALLRVRKIDWRDVSTTQQLATRDPELAKWLTSDDEVRKLAAIRWSEVSTLEDLERQDPEARRLVARTTWLGRLQYLELDDLLKLDVVAKIAVAVVAAVTIVLTALLALLFAFLVVLDLPRLSREVESIETSRLGWLYHEVRDTVVEFALSVGFFLQAQVAIAAINTALTVIGLLVLGVPSLFLLGVIVFFCGIVPVLGTYLSSVPIVLVALASPGGGIGLAVRVVILIVGVHLVEAYVLEPRIFGKRFQMNPVFVLAIVVVGYQLAGLWGLVLGIPVSYTLLRPKVRLSSGWA
ncbi:MAG TPA: AI-2E family transporter [Planctomycetota bacterium]|nr:AI-2E family transporter [Planctomycetota bacterium]